MRFLLIDTCTERGIIAYGNQQNLLFERELPFGLNQSKFLMPYLLEALEPFGQPPLLHAIGVGIGPGSYTGIRLGVAVAQALAYVWKVPLIGISSLEGFIPSASCVHFAAIIDARIGGVYLQTGWKHQNGIESTHHPQVFTLEEVGFHLEKVTHLITPSAKSLQVKIQLTYPDQKWIWEERAPSALILLQRIEQAYQEKKVNYPPQPLQLLYLRETEAEREKRNEKMKSI